jgi:hypothetical protein
MFWLQIDFISYILCIHALYHINMNKYCKGNIEIHNFQGKRHIWTKCAKIGYKKNFINSSPFALLIINVKILFNF